MIFEFEIVKDSKRATVRSVLVSEGHGCWGEPDNSYIEEKYVEVRNVPRFVRDSDVIVVNVEGEIVDVISDWQLPKSIMYMLFPEKVEEDKKARRATYETLKKEFE